MHREIPTHEPRQADDDDKAGKYSDDDADSGRALAEAGRDSSDARSAVFGILQPSRVRNGYSRSVVSVSCMSCVLEAKPKVKFGGYTACEMENPGSQYTLRPRKEQQKPAS